MMFGLLDVLMVVGPVVGYVPQYRAIQRSGSSESFSFLVSGILLWSNVLRVYFWCVPGSAYRYRYRVTICELSIPK